MSRILIIDDEKSIRHSLKEILEYENYKVDEAPDGIEGIKMAEKEKYDIIFCDIKMPRMDGIEVLENLQNKCPEVPVVMISGHGNIDTAVEAIRKGAFDFIAKPLDLNRILITVRNALDRTVLVKETKTLKRKISRTNEMIGESEGIRKIKDMIDRVAPTDARVMITGSNGTGKELVARWIHEKSSRNNMPLIEVNCAAIPSELIESELFGHEKGAFTSAIKTRSGKFEQANGGTIFLDEIGDMSLSAQAKVLRALQENRITRVGGEKDFPVDVRIIAATNKDLKSEIEKNNFREDLYHRLSVILIHVPALDDRREDIPVLTNYFLKEIADEYKSPAKEIAPDAIEQLQKKNWTGNIRELRNVVERLVILGGKTITKDDVINYVGVK
ncbi:MAG TPA: sigma-54 dependent transcriptional regulator [Bacteroidia bacterium]|nr:sigma-54-dependent Fis family transcriptional regulator [Bacteroidia bacterium]MBP7713241.1 sigma-54-dependent Fis family transcriptional regulator [Bacteroidia bacterium]MBP8667210.1 sigma-54-dependent Fis family transcriptional regulator [Bacteroidia bacterium]HOZ81824.1 sigma-54 dependent transcriptional regulator [Bacteroidia bacterium]HOZ90598.1 sigma-54 dependent transcriptional regulator [Bacteroidia bacterium]